MERKKGYKRGEGRHTNWRHSGEREKMKKKKEDEEEGGEGGGRVTSCAPETASLTSSSSMC